MTAPINPASNWSGSELLVDPSLYFQLSARHIEAIDTLMANVAGRPFAELRKADFSHPALDADLAELSALVRTGRGVVIIRGFPVARYDLDALDTLFWGIGTHFGHGHSQSAAGDMMGHVVDLTAKLGGKQSGRGYLSRRELSPHTDMTEILAMLSVRSALAGGESVIASSARIFEIIAAEHPEYLPVYERGFPYHRRGEAADDADPITPYDVPILSERDGISSCFYIRDIIDVALRDLGREPTELERSAMDFFEDVFARDAVKLETTLEPGEAIFVNNYEVLHGRRLFDDHDAPDQKRMILRLQLDTGTRPLVPEIFVYQNRDGRHGIDPQSGKTAAVSDYLVPDAQRLIGSVAR